MSLDKAIEYGKEKRKPYEGSKAIDRSCRNHGGYGWCYGNRTYANRKREESAESQMEEYIEDWSDYVTNSSSSSFILYFDKDKHSYEKFKEICEDYDYNSLLELVEKHREDNESTSKQKAVEQVNYILNLFQERSDKEDEYHSRPYYKMELDRIKGMNPIEKIEQAESIVMITVWDTSGGLLEWAIRNGFLEEMFRGYLAYILNVG